MQQKEIIIIAEAGVNHNGSLATALRMIDAAAEAGADYIKFQTFKAEELVTSQSQTAQYQKTNCGADSQLGMLKKLQLSYDDFRLLARRCGERGIGFLSTPFDAESIDFLTSLNMDYMKIPSGEITNLPYLRHIAGSGQKVIISTGMSTPENISEALDVFYSAGYNHEDICLLHCNTEYPTPMRDVNLRAMISLRDTYNLATGFSDHTQGIEIPIAAAALGASVIEKHFTLDRSMAGPDHIVSLEPGELALMVKSIRNVEIALGSGTKEISPSERKNISVARKSIVAARDIKAGELLSDENLTAKRPGNGLSPMLWDSVIGTRAITDFHKDDLIEI